MTDSSMWREVVKRMNNNERLGQAVFNTCCDYWPDVVNELRGGELDPYHNDENVAVFLAYLEEKGHRG